MLNENDTKYWTQPTEVQEYILGLMPDDWLVLEVGPGRTPLRRANNYVDFIADWDVPKDKLSVCNFDEAPLPFPDKTFDFIYCRHVLEDMAWPFGLCKEMSRVGQRGYVECPSPMVELTRGADGFMPSFTSVLPYRGYHHHRYFVWTSGDELRFVAKYPVIEYLNILPEISSDELLRRGAKYWNTSYLWEGEIKVKHFQNAVDFMMIKDYPGVLTAAIEDSIKSTDAFWEKMKP